MNQGQGLQICRRTVFSAQNKPCSHNYSNPMHLQYRGEKSLDLYNTCITECISIKGFEHFFSCSVSISLTSRCEVSCQNTVNSWQAWVGDNWTRSVVVLCLHQFLVALPASHCSHVCRTDHILKPSIATRHERLCRKLGPVFFIVVMTVLNQFLPPTLSWLTIGCLLKKVNKPARNLPVPVKGRDLTRHQWKMLPIVTEGLKLDDTESRTVICLACTDSAVGVRGRSSTR